MHSHAERARATHRTRRAIQGIVLFAAFWLGAPLCVEGQIAVPPPPRVSPATPIPVLAFEKTTANTPGVFRARAERLDLMLEKRAAAFALRRTSPASDRDRPIVRLEFAGASLDPIVAGEDELPGRIYHASGGYTGPLTGNATFRRVRYSGLYPGIDAVFYGNESAFEFDFQIAPHARAEDIALSLSGTDRIALDPSGDLTIGVRGDEIRLKRPVIYQIRDGIRTEVDGGYRLSGKDTAVRFRLGAYDESLPLVIDPTISFATYFGGAGDEITSRVNVNAAGEIYLLGTTSDPGTLPPHQTFPIPVVAFASECFLTKLTPDASAVLYTVVFDGGFCGAMAVGTNGLVHLALSYSLRTLTESSMTLGLLQGAYDLGPADGPVSQLRADSHGNVYFVTAFTPDDNNAPSFVFELRKIDHTGQLVFHSTVLPELDLVNYGEQVQGLDVDDQNHAYIVGTTTSAGAVTPTPDAFEAASAPTGQDGFLLKVNTAITDGVHDPIEYATYLGGSQSDWLSGVVFDAATNSVLVSGFTQSADFPTTPGSFAPSYTVFSTNFEGVVAKLDLSQSGTQQMVFGTYLGARSSVFTLNLLPGGLPVVSGYTFDHPQTAADPTFPLVNSLYPPFLGNDNVRNYVSIFSADGSSLLFSTYLTPALNAEYTTPAIATNGTSTLYVATETTVQGVAAGNVVQTGNNGGFDLVLRALNVSDLVTASGADLLVTATASPDPATAGTELTYSVAVKNLGPDQAGTVSLTLELSPPAAFQSATSVQGTLSCNPATGIVTALVACDLGTIAAGGVTQFDVSVVPQADGTAGALLSVTTSTQDPNSSNNGISLATAVNRPKSQTTTNVVSSLRPSVVGQSVTFTATVTGASPTGTVTFTDGGNPIGTPIVLSGGSAGLTTSALPVGSHSIVASYDGDANNQGSVSPTLVQVVNGAVTTTTALTSTPSPSSAGQPVTFTAQVTGAGPTGTVTFVDGTSTLGTAILSAGSASLTKDTLTAGSHSITASYSGDVSNLASTSSALAQTVNPTYTITDLGNLGGGDSTGFAVNNNGQVSGTSSTADSGAGYTFTHAFVVSAPYTRMVDLATLGTDLTSTGWALNSFGQVAGTSSVVSGNGTKAFLNSPPYLGLFDLGNLGSFGASALGINDSGRVTGEANTADSEGHAFVWDGSMHDLGSLSGPFGHSGGFAINASGQVTGFSSTPSGDRTAFLYTPLTGTMIGLGDFGGGDSEGAAINAAGHVTGEAAVASTFRDHAFLWDGTMHDLGVLPGGKFSIGYGINASDQIVGMSDTLFGNQHPFLYTPAQGMVDLTTLLPSGSGWGVNYAYSINDVGQIAGEATRVTCGASSCTIINHAILLTPPPPPMGAIVTGAAVAKPPSGTADEVFAVTFFNTGSQPVGVNFTSADGSAHAGADYVATSGALTFGAGVTTQFVTVPILGGAPNPSIRAFSLTLTNPSNGSVLGTATGSILVPARPPIVYTMTASPASPASIALGTASDKSSAITLQSVNGISEGAQLTAAWNGIAPNGVTFGLVPSLVSIPSSPSSSALATLTVAATASASLGSFDVRVTATSATGVTRFIDVPVTVASTPPPAGCCVSSGAFVAPVPGVAPAVTPDAQDPNVGHSSKGTYQVIVSPAAPGGLANIEVRRGSTRLLSTQATQWGFSPDEDRFVAWSTLTGNTNTITNVALYDLTRTSPQIWSASPSSVSARVLFSPSGRYLFFTAVVNGPQIDLILVNTHTGSVAFSDSPNLVAGAPIEGQDGFGTIGAGFGPNDTRFVYAYLTGATGVSWNLVNLEEGPGHALVKNLPLLNETGDYWQFSACGEVIAVVRQPGQQYVFVDLYNTADGTPAGTEVQIARPVQTLALTTTATAHVVIVNGDSAHPLTLGTLTPDCSVTSSTSPPPPPPSTSACCISAGPFVAPVPGVAPAITPDTQDPNVGHSSKGTYQVIVSPAAPGGLANIEVKRGSTRLLSTQATQWGFSPDEDRFVAWSTLTGNTNTITNVALYDLTRSNPAAAIWSDSPSSVSARVLFSPSGRYLFFTAVVNGPQIDLILVNTHTGSVAFSDSPNLVAGAPIEGQDGFGTIGAGFGPNDTRFVYAYLTGATGVSWNLVNLEEGPGHALVKNLPLLNETGDYWQFSACGEVIAVVRQPGQQFVFVDLYNTADGTPAGTEVQIARPVQTLALTTTATAHVVIVNGDSAHPLMLGTLTPDCSVSVTAHSPVDLLLVDAQGRRTGFDPETNIVVSEIPGGSFTGVGTEPETITVPLVTGSYVIEATGIASLTDAEPFRLTIATTSDSELTDQHDIAGVATRGGRQQFTFTLDNLSVTALSSAPPPQDVTPPNITANISGTPGTNGWYTSDVAVTWNVADAESPIGSSAGCTPQSVTSDTAGVTFTCTATSAGGTASSSVTVKVDKTRPTVTGVSAPPPNGNGWNRTAVTVTFLCANALSGLAPGNPPAPITLSGNGTAQSASGTCTDLAGNSASTNVTPINIDLIAPAVTAPPNQVVQQTSASGAAVTYPAPAIVETGSGLASSNCSPASGSVFPLGVTAVTCTATDLADNVGSGSFSVTVNPATTVTTDGRMFGVGLLDQGGKHEHFVFGVARTANRSTGRLEYWVNDPRRCGSDDDFDRDPSFDGSDDDDFGRDHHGPPNHFEATSISSVVFSDDPAFQPGRAPSPTVDTVRFSGSGKWNGRGGYTFEVVATDRGEPGRHRDTFSLIVKDAAGSVVVNVSGTLDGGNIESTRLIRR